MSNTLKLHPYQIQACQFTWQQMFNDGNHSGIIILPTGGGKTVVALSFVAAAINHKLVKNVLWLAHRVELISQAQETANKFHPLLNTASWTADEKEIGEHITFAMINSCRNLTRKQKHFDLVVIDECHHVAQAYKNYTNMYQNLLKRLDHTYLLGITATPERMDNKALGFEQVYYQCSFMDLVDSGHLARPIWVEMTTKQYYAMDKRGKGDFTNPSLKKLDNPKRNKKIVAEWAKNKQAYGQTLVFAINVEHAYQLEKQFLLAKAVEPHEIKVITGTTPATERQEIRAGLACGDLKIVVNCAVFTEGFDAPTVKTVLLARPTLSEALFMQMVGRGSRVKQGNNSFYVICVMDDIAKYGVMVREWLPKLMHVEPTQEQIRKQEEEDHQKAINEACEELGTKPIELGDSKTIEVEAVLCISGKFKSNLGYPIDQGRGDCLRKCHMFANTCWEDDGTFNRDKFIDNSYTNCVNNGEFPRKAWKEIAWAWFSEFILKKHSIRDDNGNHQKVWRIVSLRPITEDDQKAAAHRINQDYITINDSNTIFNKVHGGKDNGKKLLQQLHQVIISTRPGAKKLLGALRLVMKNVTSVESKDRCLTIQTSLRIKHDKDKHIWMIWQAGEAFTDALQEILDDSCCQVRFKSLK